MSSLNFSCEGLVPPDDLKVSVTTSISVLQKISASEGELAGANVPGNAVVPNLAQHIANAKDNAALWNNDVKPSIKTSLSGIRSFGDLFSKLYTTLSANALAMKADKNDEAAKQGFLSDINKLHSASNDIYQKSIALQGKISAFQNANDKITADFNGDKGSAGAAYNAAEAAWEAASRQFQDLNRQLAEAQVARSRASKFTSGLSEIIYHLEDIMRQVSGKQNEMQDLNNKARQDRYEADTLNRLSGSLVALASVALALQSACFILLNGLQSLTNNLSMLLRIENIDPNGWALVRIEGVNNEWNFIVREIDAISGN